MPSTPRLAPFDYELQMLSALDTIRIVASRTEKGEPAPEGIHRDGFDFVGIFCIQRAGVRDVFVLTA